MTVSSFIQQLSDISPNLEILSGKLDEGSALSIYNAYRPKRYNELQDESSNDPILDLISHYESEKIGIGFIYFLDELIELDENIGFGVFIEDYLQLDLDTGKVNIVDRYENVDILHHCAISSEAFLAAFLIYAQYHAEQIVGRIYRQEEILELVKKAAEAAGGLDFLPFYKVLFLYGDEPIIERTVNRIG